MKWHKILKKEVLEVQDRWNKDFTDGMLETDFIGKEAVKAINGIIDLLPRNIQTPEIIPEPQGEIALHWEKRDRPGSSFSKNGINYHHFDGKILTISTKGKDYNFVARFNKMSLWGNAETFDEFKNLFWLCIEDLLLKYFQDDTNLCQEEDDTNL